MMSNYFKRLLYGVVVIANFCANAGSYEDFFIAIRNDNAGVVQNLLERGFDPNTRDPKGQPGLTIALQERSLKAARVLLAGQAIDVDALNQAGESALMVAAIKGDMAGAQLLLERGAQVNQAGWSAIHYAATGPDVKVVQLLLDRGAHIDARSPNGSTPLMLAAQYGPEASVVLLLERGADPTLRNQLQLGAVDFARLSGRESVVQRLQSLQR